VDRERETLKGIMAKQKSRPGIDVQSLAELFAPFAEFDMLNRDGKRQLLNTITPSITAANYEIEGMWIGVSGRDDLSHLAAVSLENERFYLPLHLKLAA
jgi:hypothetical protein